MSATAAFYERLGFERHFQLPPEGEPGYVGLRRGVFEVAVVASAWPYEQYGASVGDGVRFELFVYVDEVDRLVEEMRADGVTAAPRADRHGMGRACRLRDRPGREPGRARAEFLSRL